MKNIILWTPRVIALIIIIFMLLFAFNGFVPQNLYVRNTVPLVIGLLPALILLLTLVLSWFFKLAGGITYIILGIAMSIFFRASGRELSFLTMYSPVLAVGILFVLSHFYEKAGIGK